MSTTTSSKLSTYTTAAMYLTHWLTSKPQPYVNPFAGVTGITRLPGGIRELCTKSKGIIMKYLTYFTRICITDDFYANNSIKMDMIIIAMNQYGDYKAPEKYVLCPLLFCC